MTVYDCIVSVAGELATSGLGKTRSNAQQGYAFRGIDDVFNVLAPLLAKHRLVILPKVLARSVVERPSRNGGVLFFVTVEVAYDFVSAADGSTHTVITYGEAMDSADKATNKAMSAAYKYAALQTFCIPTEGDNDADRTTHEPVTKPVNVKPAPAPDEPFISTPADVAARLALLEHPVGYLAWFNGLRAAAMRDLAALEHAYSDAGGGTKDYRQHLTLTAPAAKAELKLIASRAVGPRAS
jgi:hypothetical protein